MRPRHRTFYIATLLLALSCREEDSGPRSLQDVLNAFIAESGLSFATCGTFNDEDDRLQIECGGGVEGTPDEAFQAASACFLDKWSTCQPARVQLTWGWGPMWHGAYESQLVRTMFVVPDEDDPKEPCSLVVFESDKIFHASRVHHQECSALVEFGACDAIEPQMCSLVESIRLTQYVKD